MRYSLNKYAGKTKNTKKFLFLENSIFYLMFHGFPCCKKEVQATQKSRNHSIIDLQGLFDSLYVYLKKIHEIFGYIPESSTMSIG